MIVNGISTSLPCSEECLGLKNTAELPKGRKPPELIILKNEKIPNGC